MSQPGLTHFPNKYKTSWHSISCKHFTVRNLRRCCFIITFFEWCHVVPTPPECLWNKVKSWIKDYVSAVSSCSITVLINVTAKVKNCPVLLVVGGALKGLHLSVGECVKQSHLSFQQGGAGSLSTRFLHSKLSRAFSSCPSVSWVNGLSQWNSCRAPIMLKFNQSYFVLVSMNLICDASDGPLVCNGSWLFTCPQLTWSATPCSLSLYPMQCLPSLWVERISPCFLHNRKQRDGQEREMGRARKNWWMSLLHSIVSIFLNRCR